MRGRGRTALFCGLGRAALLEPDEGRYAEVAREMAARGDYVTPYNDWVRYFEKPPLVYWTTAAALKIFGRNEFAVRAQAALFSVGEVVVTAALGEAIFGPVTGILAAMALALSPLFFGFARFASPDPALAFFLTAGLAAFYAFAQRPGLTASASRAWMALAAAMLALGTLAKGPVALALGGGVALIWLIAEGRIRDARKIPWLTCIAVYLAIAAPWFAIAARRNPGFVQFFFVHEHLQRYLENTEHGWGPWFFIPIVAAGMWPWLYFIPLGIARIFHDENDADGAEREPDENSSRRRDALIFLLIWFGLIFIFFSIPRSKLGEYILPAFPPLAIIAGHGLWSLRNLDIKRARRLLLGLTGINAAILVAVIGATPYALRHGLDTALAADAIVAATALFAGATAATLAARVRRGTAAIAVPIALGVVIAMAAAGKAREDGAALFSYRALARQITPYLERECVLASYRHYVQALPFYTGMRERLVDYRGELAPFGDSPDALASFIPTDARLEALWASGACMVLIANRGDLARLERLLTPAPSVIGCEGKKFALHNRGLKSPPALTPECLIPAPAPPAP